MKAWFSGVVMALAPLVYLLVGALAVGEPFSWAFATRQAIFYGVLVGVFWAVRRLKSGLWVSLGLGLLAGVGYSLTTDTLAAWGLVLAWFVFLFFLARGAKWGTVGFLAFAAGFVPVAVGQVESHFSEEEFFGALQGVMLAGFWLLTWLMGRRFRPQGEGARTGSVSARWVGGVFVGVMLVMGWVVHAYQHSFYPPHAPTFPGLTEANPFMCGSVPGSAETYDGEAVFRQYLAQIEALPVKGTPEWGMLALGTRTPAWADAFRTGLLDEAWRGTFTGPANSVKSVQLDAAIRAYYFARVREAFPALFSPADETEIRAWFAAINHRALTVEWVDWMYALAFSKWPEGLYENQENGTGLLAILEKEGLAAPELEKENLAYLNKNLRGWQTRFHNTDDAYLYQAIWFFDAYFQALYQAPETSLKQQQAFEWLLLQALPDGSALTYNHPLALNPAGVAYLGATLTGDPPLLWLAGRSVEGLVTGSGAAYPVTGVDAPLAFTGTSPTQGSCLLYSDSGLPNQFGPLAPDKIVFREGWERDSMYLLLNLRFTGWHRYKGTNTISLVYQDTPLAADMLEGKLVSWLPLGRQHFRDKRIPRENLNGFVIGRTGMSAALYGISGLGGPWAQDPPYYATVARFEPGADEEVSVTKMENWRGWTQTREVHFSHAGPVVVVDQAEGPQGVPAGVVWHMLGTQTEATRFALPGGGEFVMLPMSEGQVFAEEEARAEETGVQVWFMPTAANGSLQVAGVFLPSEWAGASVRFEAGGVTIEAGGMVMRVRVGEN